MFLNKVCHTIGCLWAHFANGVLPAASIMLDRSRITNILEYFPEYFVATTVLPRYSCIVNRGDSSQWPVYLNARRSQQICRKWPSFGRPCWMHGTDGAPLTRKLELI